MSDRDLDVEAAVARWLGKIRTDRADQTVSAYRRRLSHFVDWCDEQGIGAVGELTAWELDEYDIHRREQDVKTISLNNELTTLRLFVEYCETIGLVADDLSDVIEPPAVPDSEESNDEFLAPEDAEQLLAAYRDGDAQYSREHAVFELSWFVGARKGGLAALDLDDYNREEGYVHFQHRPESETPLKNGYETERVVGLNDDVQEALDGYLEQNRPLATDDYGRRPLFATARGRAHINTLSKGVYFGTVPCRWRACPHGHQRATCQYFSRTRGWECPSSISPHVIRSGSIMWQLNCGLRPDRVAERVGASVATIKTYYDKISDLDEFRKRRADDLDKLGFDSDQESDSNV